MNNQKNKILLLIACVGIFAALLTFLYVFQPYQEKADAIVAQNTQLQAEVTRLETIASNKEKYEEVKARYETDSELQMQIGEFNLRKMAVMNEMEKEDKEMFLADMGMSDPDLDRVIRAGYDLLGLQTYFTAGVKEVRARTIH